MNWTTEEYEELVSAVIAENKEHMDAYTNAKTIKDRKGPLRYLVGQCMKMSEGLACPAKCEDLIKQYHLLFYT